MWRIAFCGVVGLCLTLWWVGGQSAAPPAADLPSIITKSGSFDTAYRGEDGPARGRVQSHLHGCMLQIDVFALPETGGTQSLVHSDRLPMQSILWPDRPLQTQSFDFETRVARLSWTVIYKAKPGTRFTRVLPGRNSGAEREVPLTRGALTFSGPRRSRPEFETWLHALKTYQERQCAPTQT